MTRSPAQNCVLMALILVASACSAFLHPNGPHEATEGAPPRWWASAISFRFGDRAIEPYPSHTTRIEFFDGAKIRVVTASDLVNPSGFMFHTPWYRLRGRDGFTTTVRVIIEHAEGVWTEAEYPLTIRTDEVYELSAQIYRREPPPSHRPALDREPGAYPLNSAIQAQPGDSLWISYFTYSKHCPDCPI